MGFDLHRMNPNIKNSAPKLPAWDAEDNEETKKAREEYFEWQDNTPGVYFRNNVWFWRPLWMFVSGVCDDILTEKDIERGTFNDGHKISKTKAERIAKKLYSMLDNGQVDEYEAEFARHKEELEDGNWNKNYPFSKDNVRAFADFCANSGGFQIC